MIEPSATAWILLVSGILLSISALFSRASERVGIPLFLLFLILGMLAGSEGIGGIEFEDYELSFRIGTIALALILFDGGLNTPMNSVRAGIKAATVLSTIGVMGTAVIVAAGAYFFGFPLPVALLLGAIVSSTDAAAVFSTLRASGLKLKKRVATTLELESGLNDPVAVILTMAFTFALIENQSITSWIILDTFIQLSIGAVVGISIGKFGRWLLLRTPIVAGGLYSVLTLAIAFLSFGLATIIYGSGFLSVYLTGLIIGNNNFPYRSGVLRFHDAAAWLSQVCMFLLLGLLVFPSQLFDVLLTGVVLSVLLVFIARPLVTMLCLLPFGFSLRESVFIGWVGLRGAVPIILAMFPVMAQVENAQEIFNLVFLIVVFSAILPGGTVGWVTKKLKLVSDAPPQPKAMLEITSLVPIKGEVLSYFIHRDSAVCLAYLRDIPLPDGVSALLILRGEQMIVPRGSTQLEPEDHVYLFCQEENKPLLNLLFGMQEES